VLSIYNIILLQYYGVTYRNVLTNAVFQFKLLRRSKINIFSNLNIFYSYNPYLQQIFQFTCSYMYLYLWHHCDVRIYSHFFFKKNLQRLFLIHCCIVIVIICNWKYVKMPLYKPPCNVHVFVVGGWVPFWPDSYAGWSFYTPGRATWLCWLEFLYSW